MFMLKWPYLIFEDLIYKMLWIVNYFDNAIG